MSDLPTKTVFIDIYMKTVPKLRRELVLVNYQWLYILLNFN